MALLFGQVAEIGRFSGTDGFLGTRASLMMDIVVVAMLGFLPLLALSIYLVRNRQRFALHKKLQLVLAVALLITVAVFEIDIQTLSPWRERAEPSPYFAPERVWSSPVGISLLVHLCFAVPAALLWLYVVVQAVRRFPHPPQPGPYSSTHAFWAWLASLGILMTAITGWAFYWLAFAA